MSDRDFEAPPQSERKKMIHEAVFDAVVHALKIGQPGLPEAGWTPIAINAAIRAAAEIEQKLTTHH